jgi:hypothetical protein
LRSRLPQRVWAHRPRLTLIREFPRFAGEASGRRGLAPSRSCASSGWRSGRNRSPAGSRTSSREPASQQTRWWREAIRTLGPSRQGGVPERSNEARVVQRAGRGGTDEGQSIEFLLPGQAVAWLLTDLSCSNFATNEAKKGRHSRPPPANPRSSGLVIRKTRNLAAAGGMTWPTSTRQRSHAAS